MKLTLTDLLAGLIIFSPLWIVPNNDESQEIHRGIEACHLNASNVHGENIELAFASLSVSVSRKDGCVCYCGGQSWSPGATACMGGLKTRCVDRNGDGTNCGWDVVKEGSEPVHCDGGENCTDQSPK